MLTNFLVHSHYDILVLITKKADWLIIIYMEIHQCNSVCPWEAQEKEAKCKQMKNKE